MLFVLLNLHLPEATFYVKEIPDVFSLDRAYAAILAGICPVQGRVLLR